MTEIYLGNDHVVAITGLADPDGTLLVAATVTANLYTQSNRLVSGISQPLVLTHTGSGNYSGIIDAAADLKLGSKYLLVVTAVEGTFDAEWRITLLAANRVIA